MRELVISLAQLERFYNRFVRHAAECQHDTAGRQGGQFRSQVGVAFVYFAADWLVLRRQATNGIRDAAIDQSQAIIPGCRLGLIDCRITNAVRCLPPQNKPVGSEVNECNTYLAAELATLTPGSVVLALGGVAHKAVIKALKLRQADYKFAHASNFPLPGELHLLSSYHCSRYNTQTKRLTSAMFADVFGAARRHLDALDSKAAVG